MVRQSEGGTTTRSDTAGYWWAVAMLRHDRPRALGEIENRFVSGTAPRGMDGPYAGKVVTTTLGYGLDAVTEAMSRLWMPWKGKIFDAGTSKGRNIFTSGGRRFLRIGWPGYRGIEDEGRDRSTAFTFVTSVGPSETFSGLDVLRIDYRDLEENPAWPIRRILDELVEVGDGLYLGQALLEWRGELRRAAWFSLES